MDGRLLAHNGVIGELDTLDAELGDDLGLVHGDTDSERIFALITRRTRAGRHAGEARVDAARWIAEHVPVFAVNLVLTTSSDLWALRYPETHELWLLERPAGDALQHRSDMGTRIESTELGNTPCVVVASEKLDDDPGWRMLTAGTLLHVGPDLALATRPALPSPPRRTLTI